MQALQFTPPRDTAALVRRRIRAGELLYLAGEVEQSLAPLQALDIGSLATEDLERALPLLVDNTDLVHGHTAATAIVTNATGAAGSDPRRRAIALALASDWVYGVGGGRRAAATEAISCAEAAGPAAVPALHRALVNLAVAKVFAAEGLDTGLLDRAGRLEAGLPALRLHDTADLHRALLNLLVARCRRGEGLDTELLERAERLEAALPAAPLHDTADLYRGLWSRYTEDLDTARAALRRCVARARDVGEDWALAMFLSYLAATEELAGDYAAATVALQQADDVAAWHDWPQPPPECLEPRCELLIATGRLDRALGLADERFPDDEGSPETARFFGALVRGKISTWRGDTAAAVEYLERAASWADENDRMDPGVRYRLDPLLAQAYVLEGRRQDADRIAAWLREFGERLDRPALIGDAARIDAMAAAVAGDLDAAAESARAAVAAYERSPLRPELARSLLTLGRIERRRKARRQSRTALRRALDLATEMGHQPLLAAIEDELPRTAAERSGTELTAAEQRVADQIASGATSREAAAALFISVRTVETHVGSIYRKLGVRTRTELRRALSSTQGA